MFLAKQNHKNNNLPSISAETLDSRYEVFDTHNNNIHATESNSW